jgi:hypothetical protein
MCLVILIYFHLFLIICCLLIVAFLIGKGEARRSAPLPKSSEFI